MKMKLFVDTNVVVDALHNRGKTHEASRLLLGLGAVGEFELWASPSQWTDMFYVLTEGGKAALRPRGLEALQKARKSVHVGIIGESEIDRALLSNWEDFEDAVVYQAARTIKPQMLITNNKKDFALSDIPIYTCEEFFVWMREEKGIDYAEIAQS